MKPAGKGPIGAASLGALILLIGWFVEPFEDTVLEAYADPVHGWAVPTACTGETGPHIRRGMTFTAAECVAMTRARHAALIANVGRCVTRPVATHEALAVLSMADNLGVGAVCRSTMVRQINNGAPATTWCEQIQRWHFAGGRDCWVRANGCYGLVTRRARERDMCLGSVSLPDFSADFAPILLETP